jgi:hypothetical protein
MQITASVTCRDATRVASRPPRPKASEARADETVSGRPLYAAAGFEAMEEVIDAAGSVRSSS